MSRRIALILGIVLVLIVAAVAFGVWWLSGSGTPSAPITAATLAPQDAGATGTLFRIDPEHSEVRFIVTEELFGSPKTVVGATNQVAGDIFVDLENLAKTQMGEIRIDVRTLETDDENRNRSLRNLILESRQDEFEFASFKPTALSGLPETPVAVGDTITFQVTGDLTVRNITNSVTFDVTATLAAKDRLEGSASAGVTREEYQLTIPKAPGVANVSDDVKLEIDFVANQVAQ